MISTVFSVLSIESSNLEDNGTPVKISVRKYKKTQNANYDYDSFNQNACLVPFENYLEYYIKPTTIYELSSVTEEMGISVEDIENKGVYLINIWKQIKEYVKGTDILVNNEIFTFKYIERALNNEAKCVYKDLFSEYVNTHEDDLENTKNDVFKLLLGRVGLSINNYNKKLSIAQNLIFDLLNNCKVYDYSKLSRAFYQNHFMKIYEALSTDYANNEISVIFTPVQDGDKCTTLANLILDFETRYYGSILTDYLTSLNTLLFIKNAYNSFTGHLDKSKFLYFEEYDIEDIEELDDIVKKYSKKKEFNEVLNSELKKFTVIYSMLEEDLMIDNNDFVKLNEYEYESEVYLKTEDDFVDVYFGQDANDLVKNINNLVYNYLNRCVECFAKLNNNLLYHTYNNICTFKRLFITDTIIDYNENGEIVFAVGKYKGKLLKDVFVTDNNYIAYIYKEFNLCDSTKRIIQNEFYKLKNGI